MPPHSYRVGQTVALIPETRSRAGIGAYVILRLLPNDQLDREYRVKNVVDGHERVVQQSDISGEVPDPFKG
jgi:hypothetical protein